MGEIPEGANIGRESSRLGIWANSQSQRIAHESKQLLKRRRRSSEVLKKKFLVEVSVPGAMEGGKGTGGELAGGHLGEDLGFSYDEEHGRRKCQGKEDRKDGDDHRVAG